MQRRTFITALGASGAIGGLGVASGQPLTADEIHGDVENIIMLIGDGMGFDPISVTSHVHGDLAMESMATAAMTRTFPRGGEVTGSAAAGTALATGLQAYNGQVSVRGPQGAGGDEVTSLTTQLEVAQEMGMSTGLVTTTRLTHATPAVYASHVPDRGMAGKIADHYLDNEVDILLGAGRREWSEDQISRAKMLGYDVLYDASDLEAADDGKLLGLFDESHLTYTLDRDERHPSLPQMSAAALDRLEGSDEGFFMMIEGGRIDHAEHTNDAWTTVAETKEFDDVVSWAFEYAEDRDDTLVVVTSDHETGGMATGNGSYGDVLDPEGLASATASAPAIASKIEKRDALHVKQDIRNIINAHIDFEGTLSDEEVSKIQRAVKQGNGAVAIGQVVSPYLGVEWPHTSHTGPGQIVLAAGPGVDEARFDGWNAHHTDLSATISAVLMFGGVEEVSEEYREQWEENVVRRGPNGIRDAYMALQYLGPVENAVTSALDIDGDGLVDLDDISRIYNENLTPDAAAPTVEDGSERARTQTDAAHEF